MELSNLNRRYASKIAADNELTRMVGLATLHAMQDRFAALGQVTVCICTVEGELITEPTWGSRFSAMIGTSDVGSRAFMESLRKLAEDPCSSVPSVCHEGLALYGVPVVVGRRSVGLIVAGTRPPKPPTAEEIKRVAERFELDAEALAETVDYSGIHTGATPEAVRQFADTMAETVATIYEQAMRIQRQLADLSIVHDLTNALTGRLDLDEILDFTVRRVVEVMAVKACGIRLLKLDTQELEVRAVCNLSKEYLAKGPVLLKANAIDAEAFSGKTVYIEDARKDSRIRYPENARDEGIVSGLCVPMTYHGETVGVLRVYTGEPYRFSESEGALLRSIASQAAAAVINSRLLAEHMVGEHVHRQLRAAGDIQRRMLPTRTPKTDCFEFGSVYVPSLDLGGDFYDLIELSDGRIGAAIADVVGKGMPAALMMASIRSVLHVSAGRHVRAADTVAEVNRHMCRETEISEFATLSYAVLSSDGDSMTLCNAAHSPPLLLRDGKVTPVGAAGFVIGVVPKEVYHEETIPLQPGDAIVMTTDGVIEALNYDGNQFGNDRLNAAILKHQGISAEQMAHQLLWEVRRFAGLADQSDDITILVIKHL